MKATAAAHAAAADLAAAGIDDAAFEADYLVRHAAGITRAQVYAGADLEQAERSHLAALLQRRLRREPAAYIVGEREFYGRPFRVTPDVLVPRPETELLVDLAVAECRDWPGAVVLDVGTGSGCIAISAALALPHANVVGVDISSAALAIAASNRGQLGARLDLVRGSLAAAASRADVVLANLPYIASHEVEALEPEVRDWEPRVALDGGGDGLDLIRALIADCATRLRPRLLALEVGFGQAAAVAGLVAEAGAAVHIVPDVAGIDRVVCARWA